jgi:uncharacterized protein (UPF0332 family)
MIRPVDFLALANRLAGGASEAEWRTAVSRAYYAAFHVARRLLDDLGFRVPDGDQAHRYLWLRLSNCGDPHVQQAGSALNTLRGYRNRADYDLHSVFNQGPGAAQVRTADQVIRTLHGIQNPVRTQITDTMKVYERDVLGDVTWRP